MPEAPEARRVNWNVIHGDCLEVLRSMPDASVDAVVTDPPYGLSFMGKRWDYDVPSVDVWAECLRVLKPGGHLLAFAGTRTQHRMAVRIEDAGFEIRDMIAWVYGSGFPKSLDVSKAIDKAAGAERVAYGVRTYADGHVQRSSPDKLRPPIGTFERTQDGRFVTAPATDDARRWHGWGTALKPAMEPITVARKPLDGTVAANVLAHGTGALNIDGCRVGTSKSVPASLSRTSNAVYGRGLGGHAQDGTEGGHDPNLGRWPANLIHDGSDEVLALFPDTGKSTGGRIGNAGGGQVANIPVGQFTNGDPGYGDSGSAARFFYCAKASRRDRNEGCEGMPRSMPRAANGAENAVSAGRGSLSKPRENHHPTVKPTDLMRYLCRLVTPPGGVVLDPFAGSGSTGKAAMLEGFRFVGIEREAEYVELASARIRNASGGQADLFTSSPAA